MFEGKTVWLNRYSIFLYISIISVVLAWFIFESAPTIRIISLLLFLGAIISFNLKNNKIKEMSIFSIFSNWFLIGVLSILSLIYIAISVGDIEIATGLMITSVILMLVSLLVIYSFGLFKTENLLVIILAYLAISFLLIVLFGLGFTTIEGFNKGHLILTASNSSLKSSWDYVYFSSSAFYSNSLGEIVPVGLSKTLMQIESAISYLYHTIIIGFVISAISNKKKR